MFSTGVEAQEGLFRTAPLLGMTNDWVVLTSTQLAASGIRPARDEMARLVAYIRGNP